MNRMGTREVHVESMGREEKILSIVLSTSELAKVDLSKIQLFQAHNAPNMNSETDSFSFFRPEEEAAGALEVAAPVVFKSKAVIEAERSVEDNKRRRQRKQGASMDDMGFESAVPETREKTTRNDNHLLGRADRRPPPLPGISKARNHTPATEGEGEESCMSGIDLKSSPALKFLAHLMPWELQPSPVTPFTPAAVPFQWEEVPGKPKTRAADHVNRRSPPPALHLPPRLLLPPRAPHSPTEDEESGARHTRSGSSGSAEEKRVISVPPASQEEEDDRSPGCVISSLECKLPSPWNGHVTPAYSPTRDLGPPQPADWGARASALITMWRKNSSAKQSKTKPPPPPQDNNKNNNKIKSLNPSRELLMGREAQGLWEEEEDEEEGNQSESHARTLNGMIAAAMAVNAQNFDLSNSMSHSNNLGTELYCPKKPPQRRTRRKWILRKLRRPARFFKAFFSALWRGVWVRKWRHVRRGNIKHSYHSLKRR